MAAHQRNVTTAFEDAVVVNKEWSDMAASYGEDPKTYTPEEFFGTLVKFLDMFDKARKEVIDRRLKAVAKKEKQPMTLEELVNASKPPTFKVRICVRVCMLCCAVLCCFLCCLDVDAHVCLFLRRGVGGARAVRTAIHLLSANFVCGVFCFVCLLLLAAATATHTHTHTLPHARPQNKLCVRLTAFHLHPQTYNANQGLEKVLSEQEKQVRCVVLVANAHTHKH